MYPFILKLIEIFKVRKESFKAIKSIRKKLKKISDDVAYVYEVERNIFEELNKHADALIRVNAEYINYYDENDKISIKDNNEINIGNNLLHFCGDASHKAYLNILPYVQNEQGYLKRLKQVLTEILNKEKPQQRWSNTFKYLVDFLIDLRYDIELFYHLLHLLKENGFLGETIEIRNKNREIIKNNVIISIKAYDSNQVYDFNQVRYWINHPKNRKWFDNEEIKMLNDLIFFIEQQDAFQLGQIIESEVFKKIFDEKEAGFFEGIVNELSQKYILTLKPLNSVPNDSTDIISIYHKYKKDALQIGKGDECDIQIVDSYIDDDVQAEIMFIINKNRFIIIRTSKKTEIKINNNLIERKFGFLDDGCIIDINGYEFQATIKPTKMLVISLKEYNQLFENKILRLPKLQIGTIQLAENLTDEVKELGELKKVAEEAEAPEWTIGKVDEQTKKDEETVFVLGEVAPEIKKIPEVKKLKKSRWRLKVSLKLPRIKKGYKNKREAINKGLAVLKESINLKNRLFDFIKYKLAKEKKEIEVLEQKTSSLIENQEEALNLKPTQIEKRRLWVLSKDEVYVFIASKKEELRQLKEQSEKIQDLLASEQYKIRREFQNKVNEYLIRTFQRIKRLKEPLQEAFAQLQLKRKSQKFLISAGLLTLLIGGFPSKVSTAFLRPKSEEEILRQIKLEIKDPATQKMLQASAFVDRLVEFIEKNKIGGIKNENLPDYIKKLISDGVLDIAIFVGAESPGYPRTELLLPIKKPEIRILPQSKLILRIRYVDNIKDAIKAFEEADVVHIESHSRFGLGWALEKEGMGNPLRMQSSPIRIPKNELYGYKGPILKDLGKEVIVQASDEDIRQIKPRKGYQLISMASCTSGQHFLEVIKRLRQGLPTTVIYTQTEVYGNVSEILLKGLASGKRIEEITDEMNAKETKEKKRQKEPYQAVVLNAESGSPESTAYDKHNIPNSLTLFYDIEL